MGGRPLTASQQVLLAAADLAESGASEFTEWQLSIAAWKRDSNRFGFRGYEGLYPDHKRVMMEIMSKAKKESPLRQGWLRKTRPNHYEVTALGLAEAGRLQATCTGTVATATASPQAFYDAVSAFAFHPVFCAFKRDPMQPKTWYEAEAFLGLARHTKTDLEDRLRQIENSTTAALSWLDSVGRDEMRSGPSGGARTITRADLAKLREFHGVLTDRFARQLDAIRERE